MAIARWSPIQELTTLHTTMDRLFGDMLEGNNETDSGGLASYRLPVDISETEDGYLIKAPIPGFKPEEVEVSVSGGVLTISAKHQEERTEKKRSYLRREVVFGNFERQIALPGDVRGENIRATFNDGVLQVEVPRTPKPKPVRIEVRGEDQSKQLQGSKQGSEQGSRQTAEGQQAKQTAQGQQGKQMANAAPHAGTGKS
jgi:HSP20 family protein